MILKVWSDEEKKILSEKDTISEILSTDKNFQLENQMSNLLKEAENNGFSFYPSSGYRTRAGIELSVGDIIMVNNEPNIVAFNENTFLAKPIGDNQPSRSLEEVTRLSDLKYVMHEKELQEKLLNGNLEKIRELQELYPIDLSFDDGKLLKKAKSVEEVVYLSENGGDAIVRSDLYESLGGEEFGLETKAERREFLEEHLENGLLAYGDSEKLYDYIYNIARGDIEPLELNEAIVKYMDNDGSTFINKNITQAFYEGKVNEDDAYRLLAMAEDSQKLAEFNDPSNASEKYDFLSFDLISLLEKADNSNSTDEENSKKTISSSQIREGDIVLVGDTVAEVITKGNQLYVSPLYLNEKHLKISTEDRENMARTLSYAQDSGDVTYLSNKEKIQDEFIEASFSRKKELYNKYPIDLNFEDGILFKNANTAEEISFLHSNNGIQAIEAKMDKMLRLIQVEGAREALGNKSEREGFLELHLRNGLLAYGDTDKLHDYLFDIATNKELPLGRHEAMQKFLERDGGDFINSELTTAMLEGNISENETYTLLDLADKPHKLYEFNNIDNFTEKYKSIPISDYLRGVLEYNRQQAQNTQEEIKSSKNSKVSPIINDDFLKSEEELKEDKALEKVEAQIQELENDLQEAMSVIFTHQTSSSIGNSLKGDSPIVLTTISPSMMNSLENNGASISREDPNKIIGLEYNGIHSTSDIKAFQTEEAFLVKKDMNGNYVMTSGNYNDNAKPAEVFAIRDLLVSEGASSGLQRIQTGVGIDGFNKEGSRVNVCPEFLDMNNILPAHLELIEFSDENAKRLETQARSYTNMRGEQVNIALDTNVKFYMDRKAPEREDSETFDGKIYAKEGDDIREVYMESDWVIEVAPKEPKDSMRHTIVDANHFSDITSNIVESEHNSKAEAQEKPQKKAQDKTRKPEIKTPK